MIQTLPPLPGGSQVFRHRLVRVNDLIVLIRSPLVFQRSNRDTRLLAGTTVSMLINTAPDSRAGGAAAGSLLRISGSGAPSSILVCRRPITL